MMNHSDEKLDEVLQSYAQMTARRAGAKSTVKRWASYAAATSAGVIASTATQTGLADVVHSGPINELMQGDKNFDIDVNNDGIDDFFMVNRREFGTTTNFGFTDYWRAAMVGLNGGMATSFATTTTTFGSTLFYTYLDQLGASQPIPGNLFINTGSTVTAEIRGHVLVNTTFGSQTRNVGNFTGNGFAGVRFDINGSDHFGWIQLDVNGFNERYTVIDWAYEDQPDTEILAGDVGSPGIAGDSDGDGDADGKDFLEIQRNDPSLIPVWEANFGDGVGPLAAAVAVPEPSTLGMLATGAAGVLGLRRQRRTR